MPPRTLLHLRMDSTHPTAQPAPSHFPFSLLLPQLLPLPALPLTRMWHTTRTGNSLHGCWLREKALLQSWSTPSPSRTAGMKLRPPEHGAVPREMGSSRHTELPKPLQGAGCGPAGTASLELTWLLTAPCLWAVPESFASPFQTFCKAERGY